MAGEEKTAEEQLKKANEPSQLAMKYHTFYAGKMEVVPKCAIRSVDDFAIWYTPGVAEPCRAIQKDPDVAFDVTNRWNSVAIVSDGTRVLGLGDIGPLAGLPVMEGKALIFKYLGGVDAFPICLDTKNIEDIVNVCKWITPSFGGINLEDISEPKCFTILDRLRIEATIPVWHDDQQGTATIVTAGVMNALKLVGKRMGEVHVAMMGAGAANIAISRVLISAGIDVRKIVMTDSKGILHPGRKDLEMEFPEKWDMALRSNAEGRIGDNLRAVEGADILISASKPGPGVVTKEMVRSMASNAIVFATANPVPEIWPWEAKEAGAKIVATGRSDFPNQINNSLVFPAVFRGALDVRATKITDEMCIAAAAELAKTAEDKGLNEEYIVPTMADWGAFPREATALGMKAIEQGVARLKMTREELFEKTVGIIKRTRTQVESMYKLGFVRPPPP
ncbi:MAG: NADP-dependent malic enzyme [Methanomassiliicoccales archaeon]|jgi:malate dehydrogenase (oxaloacetate-decarboxylating)